MRASRLKFFKADAASLVSFAAFSIGLLLFLGLASAIETGALKTFDARILLALREVGDPKIPIGPRWLPELMRDLTSLGSNIILLLLTAGIAIFLVAIKRRLDLALVVLGFVGTGALVGQVLKWFFGRPRPHLVEPAGTVLTSSFPSSHTMMATIVYLALAAVLASRQESLAIRLMIVIAAFLLIFIIGFSRVYVGFHWPSDVFAGFAAGLAFVSICYLATKIFQAPTDYARKGER
jgi:undecaprenyl-diphosphatase